MSIDLILFPLDGTMEYELSQGNVIRTRTELRFQRNDLELASQLHQVEGFPPPTIPLTPFPKGTKLRLVTLSRGVVLVASDACWLEPLCFAYAHQLRKLKIGEPKKDSLEDHRRSIRAYIDMLPDATRVFVYWED